MDPIIGWYVYFITFPKNPPHAGGQTQTFEALRMFPKIVVSPQIIHFNRGFPLFSPSVFGGNTPIFEKPSFQVVVGDTASTESTLCPLGFKAGPGWDPATGLGVPLYAALRNYLPRWRVRVGWFGMFGWGVGGAWRIIPWLGYVVNNI